MRVHFEFNCTCVLRPRNRRDNSRMGSAPEAPTNVGQRMLWTVWAIVSLASLTVGCGTNSAPLVAQSSPTSTIVTPSTTTSTTEPPLPLISVEPFTTIAPEGAYPVIDIPAGGRLPDDLPPGRYRMRLAGQEHWPEQCLGEADFATPVSGPLSSPPIAEEPTGHVDYGAMEANQQAYEAEYERICSGLVVSVSAPTEISATP